MKVRKTYQPCRRCSTQATVEATTWPTRKNLAVTHA